MIATKEYRMQFNDQARELVHQMTLEEKVEMMAGHCTLTSSFGGGSYNETPYPFGGCERLGIPELKFCDGPRGVVSGRSTCFPVAMACGATFDRDLEYRVGTVIGREVLANGGNYFGGVCMNIPYNPGAGRSQECFGEDSYHMGEMAVALMRGVQDQNVMACLKHFAFNSMETSRFKVSVDADARTEHEVFFPHFKKAVDAGAVSVMNAYNLYKGKKCGHNPYLLRDILKKKWGFDGFVISDFMWGVKDTAAGITGGCDVEMHIRQVYTLKKIRKCLADGTICEEMLDEACMRIVRSTLAFEAARKQTGARYDSSVLACAEHVSLAKEVADKSITLLQNKDDILPLAQSASVAFVGDLTAIENIGDHGSSKVRPPYVETILNSLHTDYAQVRTAYIPTKKIAAQADAIRMADAVVITCGMRHSDEGEYVFAYGGDRASLQLHKDELQMIDDVTALNQNVIVILMGGNVIMTHSWKDKVKAILFAYYPGMKGGSALTDILFGKVVPSGKLPFAIAEREDQYPAVDWKAKQQHYGYYHGYQKIDRDGGAYDFPYGFGLSYTSFALANAALAEDTDEQATFTVDVTNTGARDGDEVVQLYVSWPESPVERPVRALKGFARVSLQAGETKTVTLTVQKSELGWYDETIGDFRQDSAYLAHIGTDEQNVDPEGIRF